MGDGLGACHCVGPVVLGVLSTNPALHPPLKILFRHMAAGDESRAQTLFAEAKGLAGHVCTRHVHVWHFLGPFPIGKMEQDGDPVAARGGIQNVPVGVGSYHSEYGRNGRVGWTTFKGDHKGSVNFQFPQVNWNELVQSLGVCCKLSFCAAVCLHAVVGGLQKNGRHLSRQALHRDPVVSHCLRDVHPWHTGCVPVLHRGTPDVHPLRSVGHQAARDVRPWCNRSTPVHTHPWDCGWDVNSWCSRCWPIVYLIHCVFHCAVGVQILCIGGARDVRGVRVPLYTLIAHPSCLSGHHEARCVRPQCACHAPLVHPLCPVVPPTWGAHPRCSHCVPLCTRAPHLNPAALLCVWGMVRNAARGVQDV